MIKQYSFFLAILFTSSLIYAHPITQISYDVTILKNKRLIEVKTKQNLAFLLCKDFIGDFERYDKEYKRLTALSNEEFYKEVSNKKAFFSSIIEGKFKNLKFVNTNIEIFLDTRKPQFNLDGPGSDGLLHSSELNCEISFTCTYSSATELILWANDDFIISDILQLKIPELKDMAIEWVQPMTEKKIGDNSQSFSTIGVVKEFIAQGFLHILPYGLDHILFMLCIFFLYTSWKLTLLQVSIFTIAHSITLILVTLNVFYVKSSFVEPLIALSICVLGIENLFPLKFQKYRLMVIFTFGLLHGMGFADALRKLALPENKLILSLVSFNIGVELGQLVVIGTAFCCVGFWFAKKDWYFRRITIPCSLGISAYAFYLFIIRI